MEICVCESALFLLKNKSLESLSNEVSVNGFPELCDSPLICCLSLFCLCRSAGLMPPAPRSCSGCSCRLHFYLHICMA